MKNFTITILFVLLISSYDLNSGEWQKVGTTFVKGYYYLEADMCFDDNDIPYAVGGSYLSVKKLDGDDWKDVGNLEGQPIKGAKITTDNNNIPFIAFLNDDYKLSIMKFIDGNWVNILDTNNLLMIYSFDFELSNDNIPYISFIDIELSLKVLKFEDDKWDIVGNLQNIEGNQISTDISFTSENELYLSFLLNVMKFDGDEWKQLGTPFDYGQSSSLSSSFILSDDNTPFVAIKKKNQQGCEITVQKFDGDSWTTVGEKINYHYGSNWYEVSLAVSKDNIPYVGFVREPYNAVVNKFNGNDWELVGAPGLIIQSNPKLHFSRNGVLYSLYLEMTASLPRQSILKYDENASDIQLESQENSFNIFPNPTKDKINISGYDLPQEFDYSITDLNGRILIQSKSISNKEINIENLSNGAYLININGISKKFIVER